MYSLKLLLKLFDSQCLDTLIRYGDLDSTMTEAERIYDIEGFGGNSLIIADTQNAGQGRSENRWISPKGGLWFSLVLNSDGLYPAMALYVGAALHRTLLQLFPFMENDLHLKWPNDIIYKDFKLAGILLRHKDFRYNIGIGINTNNPIPNLIQDYQAISLQQILAAPVCNEALLYLVIKNLMIALKAPMAEEAMMLYCDKYLYAKGKMIEIENADSTHHGILKQVNLDGSIELQELDSQILRLYAGSMRLLFT